MSDKLIKDEEVADLENPFMQSENYNDMPRKKLTIKEKLNMKLSQMKQKQNG